MANDPWTRMIVEQTSPRLAALNGCLIIITPERLRVQEWGALLGTPSGVCSRPTSPRADGLVCDRLWHCRAAPSEPDLCSSGRRQTKGIIAACHRGGRAPQPVDSSGHTSLAGRLPTTNPSSMLGVTGCQKQPMWTCRHHNL